MDTRDRTTLIYKSEHVLEDLPTLCGELALFFRFEGHMLYFPRTLVQTEPQFLSKERKFILPLFWREQLLGVLVLQNVQGKKDVRSLLPRVPAILQLILEKLAQARALKRDPETDLLRESMLFERMEEEVNIVRAHDMVNTEWAHIPTYRLCMGFILIRLCNGEELSQRCGYAFFDGLVRDCAKTLEAQVPPTTLLARAGRTEFAALFQTTGREKCRTLAETLLRALTSRSFVNPLTNQGVHPIFVASFVYYPHDLRSYELKLPMYEQARLVRRRAGLACDVAAPGRVLAYAEILQRGGRIVERLPLGRYRISLGRTAGIKTSDRFSVFGVGARREYKGDVFVVQSRKKDAIVEVGYQEKVGILPSLGDVLEYVHNRGDEQLEDALKDTGLVLEATQDFYAALQERIQLCSTFAIVMLHLESREDTSMAASLRTLLLAWQDVFGETSAPRPSIGRHGPNILVIVHPEARASDLLTSYRTICDKMGESDLACACGIAGYPLLTFHKSAMQDCALKALEYALLLPAPRVGLCDSLAFTISADKRMSVKDFFGALEEYKHALALDENNDIAWNSMGVCMAALGHTDEARRHFLEALTRIQERERRAQILYNLGTVSQDLHDLDSAKAYYAECVTDDPEHVYAWIRLGQICEQQGENELASEKYEHALKSQDRGMASLARRLLARLAAKEHHEDRARSLLQEALRQNSEDAAAMVMLARLYLEAGDDPTLAEVLARKSVNIHDAPEGWNVLAQALRALGREEEANQALAQGAQAQKR